MKAVKVHETENTWTNCYGEHNMLKPLKKKKRTEISTNLDSVDVKLHQYRCVSL